MLDWSIISGATKSIHTFTCMMQRPAVKQHSSETRYKIRVNNTIFNDDIENMNKSVDCFSNYSLYVISV